MRSARSQDNRQQYRGRPTREGGSGGGRGTSGEWKRKKEMIKEEGRKGRGTRSTNGRYKDKSVNMKNKTKKGVEEGNKPINNEKRKTVNVNMKNSRPRRRP